MRLSKGVYSLHCFHPDKEVWAKAPAPKKRKAEAAPEGGDAAPTPNKPTLKPSTPKSSKPKSAAKAAKPSGEGGEGGQAVEKKEEVPMVQVQAKPLEVGAAAQGQAATLGLLRPASILKLRPDRALGAWLRVTAHPAAWLPCLLPNRRWRSSTGTAPTRRWWYRCSRWCSPRA